MIAHYYPKKISDLNEKSDVRVAVMGKIIDAKKDKFILEDISGRVEISFENADCLAIGNFTRVFCTINNSMLKADAVQDVSGLDANLFMRIEELYRKAGV
jgi:hypothetical protein